MKKMTVSGGLGSTVKNRDINRAKRFINDYGVDAVRERFGMDIPESVEVALEEMGYVVESGVILTYSEWYEWNYHNEEEEYDELYDGEE